MFIRSSWRLLRLLLLLRLRLTLLRSTVDLPMGFVIFDLSGSRSLPLYLEKLSLWINFAPLNLLGLACFGTLLTDRVEIRVLSQ